MLTNDLVYQETQVSTFYVAGAHPSDQLNCVATADDPEDFNTEHYVTYNWGFYGDDVEQTSLGWIDEDNLANRGCMSQNGSDCLSDAGWGYEDILRFYYGMDIGFAVAEGECLEDIPCEEDPECNENELVEKFGRNGWFIACSSYPKCKHSEDINITEDSFVTVKIYDIRGYVVNTLLSANLERGTHTVSWNASDFPSGLYIVRAETSNGIQSQKITLKNLGKSCSV